MLNYDSGSLDSRDDEETISWGIDCLLRSTGPFKSNVEKKPSGEARLPQATFQAERISGLCASS
jgi:hypothetical protein